MAETKDARNNSSEKGPLPRKNEPHLSHSLGNEIEMIVVDDAAADIGIVRRKHEEAFWWKKYGNIVIVAAACVAALVLLVVLGQLLGWFDGSGKPKSSPIAVAQAYRDAAAVANFAATVANFAATIADFAAAVANFAAAVANFAATVADFAAVTDFAAIARAAEERRVEERRAEKRRVEKTAFARRSGQVEEGRLLSRPAGKRSKTLAGRRLFGSALHRQGAGGPRAGRSAEGTSAGEAAGRGDVVGHVRAAAQSGRFDETGRGRRRGVGLQRQRPARAALEKVLAGTFATDDDKTAVESAIKTLAAHPSDENDALLLRVLTDAETLRPADRAGPWPAKELQPKAFELVKPVASCGLRGKLAEWFVKRSDGFDAKDPMGEYLMADDPRNGVAQLVFYKQANTPKDTKAALEKLFPGYSSKAMARYLGIPDDFQAGNGGSGGPGVSSPALGQPGQPGQLGQPGQPGQPADQPAKPVEISPLPQIANQLWSEDFFALLKPQLGAGSMERQAPLLLLAASIPQDSARSLLFKTLHKHWSEGPETLKTLGLLDRVTTDPGFLVTLKLSGTRKDPPSAALAGKSGRLNNPPAAGKKATDAAKSQKAEQDWMDVSSKMVSAWMKRFHAAAQAKAKADRKSGKAAEEFDASKLPKGFELDDDARVTAFYRVAWPDEAPPELAKLDLGLLDVVLRPRGGIVQGEKAQNLLHPAGQNPHVGNPADRQERLDRQPHGHRQRAAAVARRAVDPHQRRNRRSRGQRRSRLSDRGVDHRDQRPGQRIRIDEGISGGLSQFSSDENGTVPL